MNLLSYFDKYTCIITITLHSYLNINIFNSVYIYIYLIYCIYNIIFKFNKEF